MGEWISVKDRLPENKGRYSAYGADLCFGNTPHFMVDKFFYRPVEKIWEYGEYDCNALVTHWMPLPEPPKEKE